MYYYRNTKINLIFQSSRPSDMAYSFMYECEVGGGLTHYVMPGEESPF